MSSKSDHELVPVHEVMSEKDAKEVLAKLEIGAANLPKMLDTDPQAVKLQAKPWQIIKVRRKDGDIEYDYYRLVVQS